MSVQLTKLVGAVLQHWTLRSADLHGSRPVQFSPWQLLLRAKSRDPLLVMLALVNDVGFDERIVALMNDVVVVFCSPQRENYHSVDIRRLDFMLERRIYQFVGVKYSYNFYMCR